MDVHPTKNVSIGIDPYPTISSSRVLLLPAVPGLPGSSFPTAPATSPWPQAEPAAAPGGVWPGDAWQSPAASPGRISHMYIDYILSRYVYICIYM